MRRGHAAQGTQNLLCAYLAAAVLVGLLGNTLLGLWWLDPVAALIIVAVATKEGWKPGEATAAVSRSSRRIATVQTG